MKICSYCDERPVADGSTHSCVECVFECASCHEIVPYEKGMARDEYCDDCAVNKEELWEDYDCRACGKPGAKMILRPDSEREYNLVCDEVCFQDIAEAEDELAYAYQMGNR